MRPLCGLSEACLLSSYGLPKATLGILDRLQKLLRASAGRPLAASLWPVRSLPPLFLWASEGNVRHFGSASNAPQSLTAALPSSRQLAGLPLLFLWASEGNVRHFASRLQTLPRASPQPCPLLGRLPKATFRHFGPPSKAFRPLAASLWPVRSFSAAGRPLAASLWPVRSLPPLFLWASEGNVRHFGPASKASRQPAGLLRPLCGLSEACLLSSYGLPKATLSILDSASNALSEPQPAGLLRPLCGSCPRPASSLLMGFRRQR